MNGGKVGEVLLGDNAKIPDFKNTGEVGIISVKDSANIASLTNSGTIKALETQAQGMASSQPLQIQLDLINLKT